jgi:hypothetical protein
MSAVPPRILGPREQYIQQLWDDVWREHSQGGVFEPHIAIAESELTHFGANLPLNDPGVLDDLARAQNVHLFQSRYFAAHVGKIDGFTEQLGKAIDWTYDQMVQFNSHLVRSLTTANGAVVLAALAYIQAQHTIASGFLWVILLGATGYILTLIGSHAVVVLSAKPLSIMNELRQPRLSEATRASKSADLVRVSRRMLWWSHPFFYAAGICLVVALLIGVVALMQSRSAIPPVQTSANIQPALVKNNPTTNAH